MIGLIYEKGQGVPANTAQAITWYQRAAEQGNIQANNRLKALQTAH